MRPARRKSLFQGKSLLLKIILSFLVLAIILFFFKSQTRFWDGTNKLSLVIGGEKDEVLVATFDPGAETMATIEIPGEVEVDVARNLGVWRLGSVWQLGFNEKLAGSLLVETIAKNFKFPTYIWADRDSLGFVRGGFRGLLRALLLPYKTNLGLGDKLKLALFAFGVRNTAKVNSNLAESRFLTKTTLKSGEEGYKIALLPQKIAVIFADREVSELNLKVAIRDGTKKAGVAERVGEIIEVLGPKVALVSKEENGVSDCEVAGRLKDFTLRAARIFACKVVEREKEGNFDLEIRLGQKFGQRF